MDVPTTTAGDQMPTPSSQSEGLSFTRYLLYFVIALIIGILAPGPIAKLLTAGKRPITPAFKIAFAPIGYAYDNSATVQRFYNWYFKNLWHIP